MPIEELLMKVFAVDLREVDRADMTCGDHARRRIRMQGEPEILGEMIERAERKHAKRDVRAGKDARDGADAAVATADDDRVNLSALCLLERCLWRPRCRSSPSTKTIFAVTP